MRAAYYEKNGSARDVLRVAEVETPQPGPGEVRIKLKTSGVNPSDVKAREGRTRKLSYPRVIPHSDGAGEIDMIGGGGPAGRASGSGFGMGNGSARRALARNTSCSLRRWQRRCRRAQATRPAPVSA